MRIKAALIALACACAFAFMPSAIAGGGTWEFEGIPLNAEPVLVAGEPVHASAPLWLKDVRRHGAKNIYWAGQDQGPFFAYIVPRKGPAWAAFPLKVTEDHIYVGEVEFSDSDDPRVMDVNLDFVMPEVEPGNYGLVYCNDPCTRLIGATMPTRITVVEDEGQAFLARHLNRMDRTLINLGARSGNRVKRLESETSRLSSRIDAMGNRISNLAEQIEVGSQREPAPSSSPWEPLGIGAGAAALIFAVVSRFRRRPATVLGSASGA
jgi:hypothetical protein